jgi:hypothetical protein
MDYGQINQAGLPTRGLTYSKLLENLRESQELCAIMSHLVGLEGTVADQALAQGWIKIAENFARIEKVVTHMATGRLN